MGMAWGPGRYDKSAAQQASGQNGGQAGNACDCNKTCCVATNEVHYQVKTSSGKNAVDSPGASQTLSHRASIEFYNGGTVVFEVSNQPFTYGDGSGRPVQPNTPYILQVGPANPTGGTTHYIQGASDPFDCRITELGV